MFNSITFYSFNIVKIIRHPSNVYSQGMNDIAAPILVVFIAHQLGVSVQDLDDPNKNEKIIESLKEDILIKVILTSQKQILISVLLIFYLE